MIYIINVIIILLKLKVTIYNIKFITKIQKTFSKYLNVRLL